MMSFYITIQAAEQFAHLIVMSSPQSLKDASNYIATTYVQSSHKQGQAYAEGCVSLYCFRGTAQTLYHCTDCYGNLSTTLRSILITDATDS